MELKLCSMSQISQKIKNSTTKTLLEKYDKVFDEAQTHDATLNSKYVVEIH